MGFYERIKSDVQAYEERLSDSVARFRDRASADAIAELERAMDEAHDQASGQQPLDNPILAWANSVLGRAERHLAEDVSEDAIVLSDGTLLGVNKYENLDPRWLEALIGYLEHHDSPVAFGAKPQHVTLDASVRLAVLGDWGSGFWQGPRTGAAKIAALVRNAAPQWTVHIADTYYAGSSAEVADNLVSVWPRGQVGSLLLNGNHEMYSGGAPLFQTAMSLLAPGQQSTSYFSLANDEFFVLGLDTAYFATKLYQVGNLGQDNSQTQWLASIAGQIGRRKLVVLSHHQPYSFDGSEATLVYQQVTGALGRTPEFWYWGHLHNAIVYQDLPGGMIGRCVGHGAIPYGNAKGLEGQPRVQWYETQLAGDPDYPQRVLAGYLTLELDGGTLTETLVGENGETRFSARYG